MLKKYYLDGFFWLPILVKWYQNMSGFAYVCVYIYIYIYNICIYAYIYMYIFHKIRAIHLVLAQLSGNCPLIIETFENSEKKLEISNLH